MHDHGPRSHAPTRLRRIYLVVRACQIASRGIQFFPAEAGMGAIFLLRPHAVQIVWGLSLLCERAASADHDTL